jgi:hypothetical protein
LNGATCNNIATPDAYDCACAEGFGGPQCSIGHCPSGWLEFQSQCYTNVGGESGWADADSVCRGLNAHLVAPQSDSLSNWLATAWITDSGVMGTANATFWIGLRQRSYTDETRFTWSDGGSVALDVMKYFAPDDSCHWLVWGNGADGGTTPYCAPNEEPHVVRCCSDDLPTSDALWSSTTCLGSTLWTGFYNKQDFGGVECNEGGRAGFVVVAPYAEASSLCTSMGARLCTKDEVSAGCAAVKNVIDGAESCSHDSELIWTSSPGASKPPRWSSSGSVNSEAAPCLYASSGGQ